MASQISPQLAQAMIATGAVDIVDVRGPDEWVTGHIAGARLVPLDVLRADPDAVLRHGTTILFVCAKGLRSLTAAQLAERFGYAHVHNLDGGTKAWAAAALPLVVEQRVAA